MYQRWPKWINKAVLFAARINIAGNTPLIPGLHVLGCVPLRSVFLLLCGRWSFSTCLAVRRQLDSQQRCAAWNHGTWVTVEGHQQQNTTRCAQKPNRVCEGSKITKAIASALLEQCICSLFFRGFSKALPGCFMKLNEANLLTSSPPEMKGKNYYPSTNQWHRTKALTLLKYECVLPNLQLWCAFISWNFVLIWGVCIQGRSHPQRVLQSMQVASCKLEIPTSEH